MAGPIVCPQRRVEPSWIDYNGHMNIGYYSIAFDNALDYVFDQLGIGVDYVQQSSGSVFAAEAHLTYARELPRDAPIEITFQLLDWDPKRVHFFQRMIHATERWIAATQEQLSLHVDMSTRRSAPFPREIQERLAALAKDHAALPRPDQVGRKIAIRRLSGPVLDALNLIVANVDASVEFYRTLGIDIPADLVWRTPTGAHHVDLELASGIGLDLDSAALARQYDAGFRPADGNGVRCVIGFKVADRDAVDACHARMIGAGYRCAQPPYDTFWGARYTIIEDPDGNHVGVMSPPDAARRAPPPSI